MPSSEGISTGLCLGWEIVLQYGNPSGHSIEIHLLPVHAIRCLQSAHSVVIIAAPQARANRTHL